MLRATNLLWLVALAAPALSCSLLVQFHDQDGGSGGGGGGEGGPPADVGSDDASMDVTTTDAPPDMSVVDAPGVETYVDPCMGKGNGWYCGNNGLDELLPDADLVYCDAGAVGSLTMCEAGCLHVVDPFPDSCNPCGGQGNGDYCGRDLAGFNPDNADILIGCSAGQVDLQDACVHGCGSNGKMSACLP